MIYILKLTILYIFNPIIYSYYINYKLKCDKLNALCLELTQVWERVPFSYMYLYTYIIPNKCKMYMQIAFVDVANGMHVWMLNSL